MDDKHFTLGKIVNTHGVRGDVKVYSYAEDLEIFSQIDEIIVEDVGVLKIKSVKYVKNMAVLNIEGYNDINEIGPIMDKLIYIKRTIIEEITGDTDGHYVVDLIGCAIIDKKRGQVGVLEDVLQNTSQDLYLVKRMNSKSTFLIPVVDEFIVDIDIDSKVINVDLIDGIAEDIECDDSE